MATREYRCMKCGRVDVYGPLARPVHCGRPMKPGELGVNRDSDEVSIDLVALQDPPKIMWSVVGDPIQVLEVWVFRPGREKGEKMGWIAERHTGWEYRMVEGMPNATGATLTRNAAIDAIYTEFAR